MLPNFLIVGAEKSGTTWLHSRLRCHPDVYMPRTKEPHFFNKYNSNLEELDRYRELGIEWYERLFRNYSGQTAIGEATPMYLCDPEAPERIYEALPDVRLVACLRNPVDRAYSHYWMARGKGHTDLSFGDVIAREEPRFVQRGLYYEQLKRYYDLFPSERIQVFIHEYLFRDKGKHMRSLCSFLGVDAACYEAEELDQVVHGSSTYRSKRVYNFIGHVAKWMRKRRGFDTVLDGVKSIGLADVIKESNRVEYDYPIMKPDQRIKLIDYYSEDIIKLEYLLGRSLNDWYQP